MILLRTPEVYSLPVRVPTGFEVPTAAGPKGRDRES